VSSAVLSLGSNLGDPLAQLRAAVAGLAPYVRAVSPVYRTEPWGPVPQEDYLNAVVLVRDDSADASTWLQRAHALERAAARVRAIRFGPRTLDVDVITVDDDVSDDPILTLPHPRASERAFVLVPWLAVDPAAVLPGLGGVDALISALPAPDVIGVRLVPGVTL
jgi:2-amino-4-hydroxy-6-hydroxymethyldihydropteridine diphosphokinase